MSERRMAQVMGKTSSLHNVGIEVAGTFGPFSMSATQPFRESPSNLSHLQRMSQPVVEDVSDGR